MGMHRTERIIRAGMVPLVTALAFGGAAAGAREAQLTVVEAGFGEYLADADGRALYLFTADEQGEGTEDERTGEPIWPYLVNGEEEREVAQSACYDDCAAAWPPLAADTATTLDDRVDAEHIGTTTRRDDQRQVTYAGQPLYYFVRDSAPGDVSGQGVESFGGVWYLVDPDGDAIEPDD